MSFAGHDDVEVGRHLAGIEARRREGGLPDGASEAAVEEDDDGVEEDADEREAQARIAAVLPEPHEQQAEAEGQQGTAQGLGASGTPAVEERLRPEADDDRGEQDPDPAQLDRPEVAEAPGPQAEEQADEDAGDQHAAQPCGGVLRHADIMLERGLRCADVSGRLPQTWFGAAGPAGATVVGGIAAVDSGPSVVIRLAAWPMSGIGRGWIVRPGSATPSTWVVRTNASTTTGSNWIRRTCAARRGPAPP